MSKDAPINEECREPGDLGEVVELPAVSSALFSIELVPAPSTVPGGGAGVRHKGTLSLAKRDLGDGIVLIASEDYFSFPNYPP